MHSSPAPQFFFLVCCYFRRNNNSILSVAATQWSRLNFNLELIRLWVVCNTHLSQFVWCSSSIWTYLMFLCAIVLWTFKIYLNEIFRLFEVRNELCVDVKAFSIQNYSFDKFVVFEQFFLQQEKKNKKIIKFKKWFGNEIEQPNKELIKKNFIHSKRWQY